MRKKTPGRISLPSSQSEFDKIRLKRFCVPVQGLFQRVHGLNPSTGNPYPPIHFSRLGNSRFDPKGGIGTLCIGNSLAVALMEVFDDSWGAVGTSARALTARQLNEWWVTMVCVPKASTFDARGHNLSKIGTDQQLVTGKHSTARHWALRLLRHPAGIDGILYPSRHTTADCNVALFRRAKFLPEVFDPALDVSLPVLSARMTKAIAFGPSVLLAKHPNLKSTLRELEVAMLP